MTASGKLLTGPVKWSIGCWSLFIAENYVLSENRTAIISHLGDDNYHYMYGLCSTAAVSSIAYGYQYKVKGQGPMLWKPHAPIPPSAKIAAFLFTSLGLGLMSQTAPKLQIPFHYGGGRAGGHDDGHDNKITHENYDQVQPKQVNASNGSGSNWKVRCPFDFTDSKSQSLDGGVCLHGVDRITRHPGLWSFGLVGLGSSFLTPSLPTTIWLAMPMMVALVGGGHTDSRFRRGMGGTLSKELDDITSNVPFWAIISGKQEDGDVLKSLGKLTEEIKGLNTLIAMGVAASFVASRGRNAASGSRAMLRNATR